MAVTKTANKSLDIIGIGDPNWGVNVNNTTALLDQILGNAVAIAAVNGTRNLTVAQIQNACLIFTGALTANARYNLPTGMSGSFIIINSTTGSFNLTIGSADGGTTVVIPQGKANSVFISSLSGVGGALFNNTPVTNTSLDKQVLFNTLGAIDGSPSFTYDAPNLTLGGTRPTLTETCVGSTATLTFTSTTGKAIPVGSFISVTGILPAEYNGNFLVTASAVGSVSYTVLTPNLGVGTKRGTLHFGGLIIGGETLIVTVDDLNKVNAKLDATNIATQADIDAKTANKLIPANLYQPFKLVMGALAFAPAAAPAWYNIGPEAKKITIAFSNATCGTGLVQIGSAAGDFEGSGYSGGASQFSGSGSTTPNSNSFRTSSTGAGGLNGIMTLVYMGNNLWAESWSGSVGANSVWGGGAKQLSGTLDRVRLADGSLTAGAINITWE
jgi:hypothetical protein